MVMQLLMLFANHRLLLAPITLKMMTMGKKMMMKMTMGKTVMTEKEGMMMMMMTTKMIMVMMMRKTTMLLLLPQQAPQAYMIHAMASLIMYNAM